MRLVFPEVRLREVRVVWQPPLDPNGIIMGKKTLKSRNDECKSPGSPGHDIITIPNEQI